MEEPAVGCVGFCCCLLPFGLIGIHYKMEGFCLQIPLFCLAWWSWRNVRRDLLASKFPKLNVNLNFRAPCARALVL